MIITTTMMVMIDHGLFRILFLQILNVKNTSGYLTELTEIV
jgi:hypothetical protein